MIEQLNRTNGSDEAALSTLEAIREGVVEQLLGDLVALRSAQVEPGAFEVLDLRAESMESDEVATGFYQRLAQFLSGYAQSDRLHTMTAFSLPEGREPATVDRWIFLAFDGVDGEIVQRPIEVADPATGETVIEYGMDETVSAAAADEVITEALEEGRGTRIINQQHS